MKERVQRVAAGLPAGAVSSVRSRELTEGWALVETPPGTCSTAADAARLDGWRPAVVPGTAAAAVAPDSLDGHPSYDASDWWYRCDLPEDAFEKTPGARHRLRFDGLATLAEVWLNGSRVLRSSNMFRAWEVDVTDLLEERNELLIAFRSLDAALAERRPRPRWKTRLVGNQQLRWFRTTLLGRMPGWTPAISPVGPWRSIWAQSVPHLDVASLDVRTTLHDGAGAVRIEALVRAVHEGVDVRSCELRVGDARFAVEARPSADGWTLRGTGRLEEPRLWWPRTHGDPFLHGCGVRLDTSEGEVSIDCGAVGFRTIELDRTDGRIHFVVNGVPVFCRGSCWTSNDIVSLVGDPDRMRRTLELLAEANGNMVRVGGTMVYETDAFYAACDELGIMVWQDFMFANMDYPVDHDAFRAEIEEEASHQLHRLSSHPSVVAYCGGSEVEQQAAMFGAPREIWSNPFFQQTLPSLVERYAPGTPYWPSTPTGGVLPFHVAEGLSHYYGVGAYRRPLEDARLAGVKFSPECLGLSHVPETANLRGLSASGAVPPHDPAWKRGVPRDSGTGWDFEDVRDHYLASLYGLDAVGLRSENLPRYLEISRVVTGEVMAAVFGEWRRADDPCGGGLTWFLQDLRPGAGWGLIDSGGIPKACYHQLRRCWQPIVVRLLDRGLDGLLALVINESARPFDGEVELLSIARGAAHGPPVRKPMRLAPRSSAELSVEEAFGYFMDSTYSYRFGPPRHEALVARLLRSSDARVVSEDVHRPDRSAMTPAPAPATEVETHDDGAVDVTLRSDAILYDVRIVASTYRPSDDHFCLTPGRARTVRLHPSAPADRTLHAYVEALNLAEPVRLSLANEA